jgi:hypothetical protein
MIVYALLAFYRPPTFHKSQKVAFREASRRFLAHQGDLQADEGNDLGSDDLQRWAEFSNIHKRFVILDFSNQVQLVDGLGSALRTIPRRHRRPTAGSEA